MSWPRPCSAALSKTAGASGPLTGARRCRCYRGAGKQGRGRSVQGSASWRPSPVRQRPTATKFYPPTCSCDSGASAQKGCGRPAPSSPATNCRASRRAGMPAGGPPPACCSPSSSSSAGCDQSCGSGDARGAHAGWQAQRRRSSHRHHSGHAKTHRVGALLDAQRPQRQRQKPGHPGLWQRRHGQGQRRRVGHQDLWRRRRRRRR